MPTHERHHDPRRHALRALPWSLLALVMACESPSLRIDPTPTTARVALDGEPVGSGPTEMRQPYHGTARIDLRPRVESQALPTYRRDSQLVELEAPVSPWLFPFDLVVELVSYPWREELRVIPTELERLPELTEGVEPVGMPELRERAAGARAAR